MVKKIALEEHFLDPSTVDYWRPTMVDVAPPRPPNCSTASPISASGGLRPWTRPASRASCWRSPDPAFRSSATPRRQCAGRASNDFLAHEVQKCPDRYSGFAHLAMQDAKAAADELERCMRELKFCGAMIDGHTHGKYLDDRSYDPFWERAAELGAPIYLHPAED